MAEHVLDIKLREKTGKEAEKKRENQRCRIVMNMQF